MWLRVVPEQFFLPPPHFITVPVNDRGQTVVDDALTHDQADGMIKIQFTRYARQRCSPPYKRYCGTAHSRVLFHKGVKEEFIIFRSAQGSGHMVTRIKP